mmetsp:Transcript_117076/g.327629  ORF Transcript_117076/g.327629 Transcript_117076/m.327629 type:complete len:216 (-) Transcript_117076:104-751(-)
MLLGAVGILIARSTPALLFRAPSTTELRPAPNRRTSVSGLAHSWSRNNHSRSVSGSGSWETSSLSVELLEDAELPPLCSNSFGSAALAAATGLGFGTFGALSRTTASTSSSSTSAFTDTATAGRCRSEGSVFGTKAAPVPRAPCFSGGAFGPGAFGSFGFTTTSSSTSALMAGDRVCGSEGSIFGTESAPVSTTTRRIDGAFGSFGSFGFTGATS